MRASSAYQYLPLRRFVTAITDGPFGSSLTSSHYTDKGARVIRLGNIGLGEFRNEDAAHISIDYFRQLKRHEAKVGDLVIAGLGDLNHPVGRACIVPKEIGPAIVKADCFRVRLDEKKLTHKYAMWAMYDAASSGYTADLSHGSTRARINLEVARSIHLPVPPVEEQRRIADFLDTETQKIDNLISKKRHLISLMHEHIDSRILSHVRESQLVKTGWGAAAVPIRRMLTKVVRPPIAEVDVVTAYRDGHVTARGLRRAEGYTLSASTEPQGQHVQVDDVVIHGLDGFAGAIGTSEAVGNCSPVYHICVPASDGDPKFLGRLLRLLALQGYLGNFATSTRERAVDFRNWDLFGRIPIPVVSAAEQKEIGNSITKIGPLKAAIERSEVLAAERRRALVTAAVTGQFDVSTASGRGVMG